MFISRRLSGKSQYAVEFYKALKVGSLEQGSANLASHLFL